MAQGRGGGDEAPHSISMVESSEGWHRNSHLGGAGEGVPGLRTWSDGGAVLGRGPGAGPRAGRPPGGGYRELYSARQS